MNQFVSRLSETLDTQSLLSTALWSAGRIAEHETVSQEIVSAIDFAIVYMRSGDTYALECATNIVLSDETCPSGIRSAILAFSSRHNMRLHALHAYSEAAKVLGWHHIVNVLSDMLESGEQPIAVGE